jgi:Na+/H+ antiporter NhaD/arsenite permease-like protein
MISVIVLGIVFLLIAVRKVGGVRFQIWQVMLLGALAVLITAQISLSDAWGAIDLDVILFLFGMFVLGEALDRSGYLDHLSNRFFRTARRADTLVLLIIFGAGLGAAFLMNDTLAIIGTPLVLLLAVRNNMRAKPLLLALAFAITTGSVMSPIGNPQNLLIALGGNIANPFITFARYLALPTVLNLLMVYFILKLYYRRDLQREIVAPIDTGIKDARLAGLCRVSLVLLLLLIAGKIVLVFVSPAVNFRLTYIALAAMLPVVLFSPRRFEVVKNINWSTLVFFAAMFILMASVWNSGYFQTLLADMHIDLGGQDAVMGISVVLSQFISNVPMVALYLPVLARLGASTGALMALAAGSTIAGNLTILGAASNVIIIQNCEMRSSETISFWEFFKIGLPLTAINTLVYLLFFKFM